jgi:hypothetical protein
MSVPKGTNGKQAGKAHFDAVQRWVAERERLRDWHEYQRGEKINRTALAAELGFDRGVIKDNPKVRELVEARDKLWFGSGSEKKKEAQEARLERSSAALSKASSENNKLVSRIAELEAENRELRRENTAFKRMQSMIEAGEPGFRV